MPTGSGLSSCAEPTSLPVIACVVAVVSGMLSTRAVLGHEDILLQIERLDARIEAEGESARLLFDRGELRRVHEEWDLAEGDLRRALELDPALDAALLGLVRNALGRGDAEAALQSADEFLARHPGDPMGSLERARACARLGRIEDADAGFEAAVGALDRAGPELYYEWAAVLKRGGEAFRAEALQVLDEGIRGLGPLVTLVEPAVEIERESGNVRGALARVEGVLRGPLARSVPWHLTKAELLLESGRPGDAARTIAEARGILESLPARRRNVPAMLELAERLEAIASRCREDAGASTDAGGG